MKQKNKATKKTKKIKTAEKTKLDYCEEFHPTTLGEFLQFRDLNMGIIRMTGEINSYLAEDISQAISYIYSKGLREIKLFINSPGGEVSASFAILDNLMNCGMTVTAIVQGYAASAAAAIILQAADYRISLPKSRFLLHEVSQWSFGVTSTSELRDEAKELEILSDMIYELLAKRCHKSVEEIKKLISRKQVWMSAQEALEFGLIDKIIGDTI